LEDAVDRDEGDKAVLALRLLQVINRGSGESKLILHVARGVLTFTLAPSS
jgi:hypothetical protein